MAAVAGMGWIEDTRDGKVKLEAVCCCQLNNRKAERVHIMSSPVATAIMAGEEAVALTVLFHPCEEGGFTAECIELPGCFSEGETQDEAERNIRLAIDACLGVLFEDCLERIRRGVDLSSIDLRNVSKQERLSVKTPRIFDMPEYA